MNKELIQTEGGVCAAKGFKATGLVVGIKKLDSSKKDMAMIYSDVVCKAAGTFTSNLVKAAPVKWDYKLVHESDYVQAVVVNSGVANAATGEEGMKCCMEMSENMGKALGIPAEAVLVASTGVIGRQLPMDIINAGIAKLPENMAADEEHAALAAQAIMTTDTHSKQVAVRIDIDGV